MRPNKLTTFVACLASGVVGGLKGFCHGLGKQSAFGAALLEAWAVPQLPKWKLKNPILPLPMSRIAAATAHKPVRWEDCKDVKITFDKDGYVSKVVDVETGTDVTDLCPYRRANNRFQVKELAGTMQVIREIHPSRLQRWFLSRLGISAIRPWKFKNNVKDDDFRDPAKVVQAKIKGILIEVAIDKEGTITKAVLARGGKTDVLPCLPELRGFKMDPNVRDAKLFIEAFHPKGEEFTSSILHSKPENAADTIKAYGHPKFYVLSVARLGGIDVSKYQYDQMRALTELVARKLPQGMVPEQSEGTEAEKRQFVDRIRKENEVLPAPKCDGVVIYPKEAETKGAVIQRHKFPMTGKFVVMALNDSDKAKDAVASIVIGDGQKRLGKVNVSDAGMRSTIKLNPDRYVGKVVQVEYARQTKSGSLINPVLKRFLFAEPPTAVEKWTEEKKVG